jgi:hypothetical protein
MVDYFKKIVIENLPIQNDQDKIYENIKKTLEKKYVLLIKKSTQKLTEDPSIEDNLKRELLCYKNQIFNMRYWLLFYTSGLVYIFKVGNLKILQKLGLVIFFFIPNLHYYRKLFKKSKIKILDKMLQNDIEKFRNANNEDHVLQFERGFENYLNNNL